MMRKDRCGVWACLASMHLSFRERDNNWQRALIYIYGLERREKWEENVKEEGFLKIIYYLFFL